MYFIISLLLCSVLFTASTILKTFTTSDEFATFFLILQIIFVVAFFVFLIVMVFYNLDWHRAYKKIYNKINKIKKEIVLSEAKYKELSEYYNKCISDGFPTLEKDLFSKIADNQPKELIALLQNYPELQSSKLYSDMTTSVSHLISSIYIKKNELYENHEKLENIHCDGWILIKPKNYAGLLTEELHDKK
jgi:Na+-transporting NADH:ubiquinone oxidoreductase subunit NqrC